jgi:hypothetical protein
MRGGRTGLPAHGAGLRSGRTAFRWNERAGGVLDNLSMLVRFSRFPLAYGTLTA